MKLHELLSESRLNRKAVYGEYTRILDPADTGMITMTPDLQGAVDTILDELQNATPDPAASEECLLVVDNVYDWSLSEIVIEPKNLKHAFIASTPVEALAAMEVEIPPSSDTTDDTFLAFLVADLMLYGLTHKERLAATEEIIARAQDTLNNSEDFVSFEEVERNLGLDLDDNN